MSEFPRPIGRDESKTSSAKDGALPRAIKFEDIRVGDRVRHTIVWPNGVTITEEGVVCRRSEVGLEIGEGDEVAYLIVPDDCLAPQTFELLSRPKPELEAKQIWRRADGALFTTVWDDNGVVLFVDSDGYLRGESFREREADRLEYVGEAEIGVRP